MRALLEILLTLLLVSRLSASPIVLPPPEQQSLTPISQDFCFLPPEYGSTGGKITYLEDCPVRNLRRYSSLPKVVDQYRRSGVHPKVCCPEYLSPYSICTPSDAWCPTYQVRQGLVSTRNHLSWSGSSNSDGHSWSSAAVHCHHPVHSSQLLQSLRSLRLHPGSRKLH